MLNSGFVLTNLTTPSFIVLNISGDFYLSRVQDVKLHAGAKKLSDRTKTENTVTAWKKLYFYYFSPTPHV